MGRSGQTVVGLVGAYIGYALESTETYGRLTGMVVDEQYRGKGVDRLLMERIESSLLERGVKRLFLTSGSHRTEAHDFISTWDMRKPVCDS